jgi:hypothetical protein
MTGIFSPEKDGVMPNLYIAAAIALSRPISAIAPR